MAMLTATPTEEVARSTATTRERSVTGLSACAAKGSRAAATCASTRARIPPIVGLARPLAEPTLAKRGSVRPVAARKKI
jgi:hypothetical protein